MLLERIKGAVVGGAIGDALGTLVEEMDRETVHKAYGGVILGFREPSPLSVCPFLKKGQFSHETQVFLMALEVYADKGYFDENLYIEKLVEWVKDEKSHRYPSGAHVNAALAYMSGQEPSEARVKACDIDGAIPAFAAGIFRWDSSLDAYEEGAYIASITHSDETLIDSAGVLAVAVSELLGGRVSLGSMEDKKGFIDILKDFARTEMLRAYLDILHQVVSSMDNVDSRDEVILQLGNGSFAPEALSLSLYFAISCSDFRKGVLSAVNSYGDFGGDTDAIAFITGGLLGGYYGISAIPKEWIECLESNSYLFMIANKMFEKIKG